MPRLDAFIEKLLAVPSAELVFETGNGAVLQGPTERLRLLQQPLTTGQIVGAFAEVLPSELQNGFPRAGTTAFAYAARGAAVPGAERERERERDPDAQRDAPEPEADRDPEREDPLRPTRGVEAPLRPPGAHDRRVERTSASPEPARSPRGDRGAPRR